MKIGVFALQGAFIEHIAALRKLGCETQEIRQKKDFTGHFDGIILPGGESTVQRDLFHSLDLWHPVKDAITNGLPVMGTCAGLILLAEKISGERDICFGTLPVTVKRNAYGRQLGSFEHRGQLLNIGSFPMVFIRAPYIECASQEVQILAAVQDKIVAVRYQNQMGLSFHPELTQNTALHRYFLTMAASYARQNK